MILTDIALALSEYRDACANHHDKSVGRSAALMNSKTNEDWMTERHAKNRTASGDEAVRTPE